MECCQQDRPIAPVPKRSQMRSIYVLYRVLLKNATFSRTKRNADSWRSGKTKRKSLFLLIFRCLSRSTGSHQVVETNACLTRLNVNDTRREGKKNEKLSSGVRLSSRWKNKRVENKKKQNDNLN